MSLSIRAIARQLGRPLCSVHGCLQHTDSSKRNPKCGRPRKVSAHDERRILRVASNSTSSINGIRLDFQLSLSETTTWRVLKRSSAIVREEMKKLPETTDQHKATRMVFAQQNITTDWSKVMVLLEGGL
ncbi:hypothetical protein Y032_0016g3107 [Ancylostoma ceylanicum]|uniref:Transposable element Tc3 transposase-like DNA-binding HTH domain-containing protein n=1 Tax=Ancylostoma ceylanicum TaxID=53326 RepID=A0A016V7V8_9BILA|nr:hypothetical protein Y032_0016g3107 [Ancylostoma ceylanicum]